MSASYDCRHECGTGTWDFERMHAGFRWEQFQAVLRPVSVSHDLEHREQRLQAAVDADSGADGERLNNLAFTGTSDCALSLG